MQSAKAIRRLKANFCYFNKLGKNFCQNITSGKPITAKKPFESIIYKPHNNQQVMEILLNEPKKLNSLDMRMIKSLLRRVRQWMPENKEHASTDEDATDIEHSNIVIPKVVLMSGAGKAFCAGGDISSLYHAKTKDNNDKLVKDFFRYEYLLDYYLTRMSPVQVALWNGYVMGGGVGISIHAPIRVATENTMFAMPETAIGFFPDVGGTYFLPRLFGGDFEVGMYMGLTGDRIKGKDLAKCGVATHFVPADKLDKLKNEIIANTNATTDLNQVTEIVNSFSELVYNPKNFEFPRLEDVKKVFNMDEGTSNVEDLSHILSRLENLSVNGSEGEIAWASNALKLLNRASPISLLITMEQLKRGANLASLEDAYNMEAQIVAAFVEDSDFFEGVRALLIDKDNSPNWKVKSLKEIDEAKLLNRFFDRAEILNVDPNVAAEGTEGTTESASSTNTSEKK